MQGTRHIIQSAAKAGVKKIIYISSAAALDHSQQPLSEETWNPVRLNAYEQSKTDSEKLAFQLAKQLGIDHRVGSIEVGKDADLVIFQNHPLSVYGVPQVTIVEGVVRCDRTKDADDLRLAVDPNEPVEAVELQQRDHDSCLEGLDGAFDTIFGLN